eukprot:scaffold23710_cov31-Tisochrysis_lutea.AAC.1
MGTGSGFGAFTLSRSSPGTLGGSPARSFAAASGPPSCSAKSSFAAGLWVPAPKEILSPGIGGGTGMPVAQQIWSGR